MGFYKRKFYERLTHPSKQSSEILLKYLFEIIPVPKTAIDVGCGVGAWASTLKEHGVESVLGIDGDYVDRDLLLISREEFIAADLALPVFPSIQKRFDLAISLEVAEHLPESRADSFIQDLTDLSDTVLFSAAIPHQGGTNHINCQWQSYWIKKFMDRGYQASVTLRDKAWNDPNISVWYRQNNILFMKSDSLSLIPCADVVHPERYTRMITKGFGYTLKVGRRKIKNSIRNAFR